MELGVEAEYSNNPRDRSQPGDLLQMHDCSGRAGRVGEQIEGHLLVVTDRCECGVLVRSSGWIAHDDDLEHKEARDHRDVDGMFAERFPNEPGPEDEGALARGP